MLVKVPVGVNISLRQRRLKRDRRFQRIGEAHAAIVLIYGNEMSIGARKVQKIAADGRRRKNLPARCCMRADDFRLPRLPPIRSPHGVNVIPLRVQNLSLAYRRARTLKRPGTGDGTYA